MAGSSRSPCSTAGATTACGWCPWTTGTTTQLLEAMRGHYELAFAPDDSALYVAGGDPFITRIPFDKQSGRVAGERELMPVPGVAGVRGLTVSPDGRLLDLPD